LNYCQVQILTKFSVGNRKEREHIDIISTFETPLGGNKTKRGELWRFNEVVQTSIYI